MRPNPVYAEGGFQRQTTSVGSLSAAKKASFSPEGFDGPQKKHSPVPTGAGICFMGSNSFNEILQNIRQT
jgi:hypothetical protein